MSNQHFQLKAEMARNGLGPMHVQQWWSPDTERMVDPMDDPETIAAVKSLLGRLWDGDFHGEAS